MRTHLSGSWADCNSGRRGCEGRDTEPPIGAVVAWPAISAGCWLSWGMRRGAEPAVETLFTRVSLSRAWTLCGRRCRLNRLTGRTDGWTGRDAGTQGAWWKAWAQTSRSHRANRKGADFNCGYRHENSGCQSRGLRLLKRADGRHWYGFPNMLSRAALGRVIGRQVVSHKRNGWHCCAGSC